MYTAEPQIELSIVLHRCHSSEESEQQPHSYEKKGNKKAFGFERKASKTKRIFRFTTLAAVPSFPALNYINAQPAAEAWQNLDNDGNVNLQAQIYQILSSDSKIGNS